MNKSRLKNNAWTRVRIRPIAKRFYGSDGPQLPPVDDTWIIQTVGDDGVRLSNTSTGHGTVLAFDQIHHYAADPDRGDRNGFLILNTQLSIGGNRLWCDPTFRPGEALPDAFGDVRGWRREDDQLYLQSLYAPMPQVVTSPTSQQSNIGVAVLLCLCIGAGFAIANT